MQLPIQQQKYNQFNKPYGAGGTGVGYDRWQVPNNDYMNKYQYDPIGSALNGSNVPYVQKPQDPMKNLMGNIQSIMAMLKGSSGTTPMLQNGSAPMGNSSQQYLNEIRALMQKLQNNGLPALTPQMQQELAQRKDSMQREINQNFATRMGESNALMFGRGMENSGLAHNTAEANAVDSQRAVSDMLSNLFNQEMGLRSQMGQTQNQGIMSEIGVLQNLMQGADQRDLMNAQNAREDQRFNIQNSQNDQNRIFQLIQMLLPMMQQYGGR